MKNKLMVLFICSGLILPVLSAARPLPMMVKAKIMSELIQQTQPTETFAEQFNRLRKQYPAYKQEITAVEEVHKQLLQETKRSLSLAQHCTYYLDDVLVTLAVLHKKLEAIKDPATKKACIKLLNHPYSFPTVRNNPSDYSYRANLKQITEEAVRQERDRMTGMFAVSWPTFYNQFDCKIETAK